MNILTNHSLSNTPERKLSQVDGHIYVHVRVSVVVGGGGKVFVTAGRGVRNYNLKLILDNFFKGHSLSFINFFEMSDGTLRVIKNIAGQYYAD